MRVPQGHTLLPCRCLLTLAHAGCCAPFLCGFCALPACARAPLRTAGCGLSSPAVALSLSFPADSPRGRSSASTPVPPSLPGAGHSCPPACSARTWERPPRPRPLLSRHGVFLQVSRRGELGATWAFAGRPRVWVLPYLGPWPRPASGPVAWPWWVSFSFLFFSFGEGLQKFKKKKPVLLHSITISTQQTYNITCFSIKFLL